ncbi:hypothetical protein [Roseovarius sp. Pro17]|uniref:hypothetical protein n=1 Tax=Roseovarius sp. Pro17 TaxID=3108175 RepID=UPI002D797A55|nr:hypothetical protein [Roseovarius sp. Pro17]
MTETLHDQLVRPVGAIAAPLADDLTLPENACARWRSLCANLAGLNADLIEHIHLESNVLLPRFETTSRN